MDTRRLLVTDLDGTLLGDADALARFRRWIGPRRSEFVLVYASGRLRRSIGREVHDEGLPMPDVVISAVGTEIHDTNGRPWPGWLERFGGSPADRAREALQGLTWLEPQPAANQTGLKASYDVPRATSRDLRLVHEALAAAGLRMRLVYSGDLHLDVLPDRAGKGLAGRFVADSLGIPTSRVLAFGDSGNDVDLLSSGFRGTIVANALPELRGAVPADVYRSPLPYADGVLDGIRFWLHT